MAESKGFFGALPCTFASLRSLTPSAKTVHRTVSFRRLRLLPPCSNPSFCFAKAKSRPCDLLFILAESQGFEPQVHYVHSISSLLVSVSTSGRFVPVSGRFVCAESRINKAFSPIKPCCDCIFSKWVQIGIFADFGEKLGETGEKSREKAIQNSIHRRKDFKPTKSIF